MALSGCLAVVTGGSGIVGAGIVHGFLSQGATTVAPCRSQKGAEALRQSLQDAPGLLSQLQTPLLDVSSEEEASKFVSSLVEQHGCIDHAVSCLGGWWQKGQLTQQSLEEFDQVVANQAKSHFVFSKALLPAMRPKDPTCTCSFTFVSGGAGVLYRSGQQESLPDASLTTVGTHALYGVIMAAQAEFAESPVVRVNELRIHGVIRRHSEQHHPDFRQWPAHDHRAVGRLAVELAVSNKRGCRVVADPEMLQAAAAAVEANEPLASQPSQ